MFTQLWDSGVNRPAQLVRVIFLYNIFSSSPTGFYIFRWFEVLGTLLVWGYIAFLVTGKKIAFPLLIAVTLGFYNFYDAFFFLSTQEIMGLLFSGIATALLLRTLPGFLEGKRKFAWGPAVGALFCFLTAFGFKETFFIFPVALGVGLPGRIYRAGDYAPPFRFEAG